MEEEKNKPQQPTANTTNSATTTNNGTGNPDEFQDEFYNSGRIGRRNAMPDILGNGSQTSTADLPLKLSALTTSGIILFIKHIYRLARIYRLIINFIPYFFFLF